MSMENTEPTAFNPADPEHRKKARELYKAEIEKEGLPAHRVIKITDTFYDLLKRANQDQLEFLVGMSFAMFDNAKKVWAQKRMKENALIKPDTGIIKPGGQS